MRVETDTWMVVDIIVMSTALCRVILFLPKPKEDIGLFVNDVCCQYTQTIFVFDGSGWTILMEGTLGNLFANTLNINMYSLSWSKS